jgi:hypothetical protein
MVWHLPCGYWNTGSMGHLTEDHKVKSSGAITNLSVQGQVTAAVTQALANLHLSAPASEGAEVPAGLEKDNIEATETLMFEKGTNFKQPGGFYTQVQKRLNPDG